MSNPIIAALDVPTANEALTLAKAIAPAVGAFKIGKELFVAEGPDIVRRVRDTGAAVFLDLKFHDIPNTVAKAVTSSAHQDVQMLTVHASGGTAMLRAAQEAAGDNGPLVLGVTVLTSMDEQDLTELGIQKTPAEQVRHLAQLAAAAGLRAGVFAPGNCAAAASVTGRSAIGHPGIRPAGSASGDQKRVMTPADAITAGADWLVIGRPIYAAENPREAAEAIRDSLG